MGSECFPLLGGVTDRALGRKKSDPHGEEEKAAITKKITFQPEICYVKLADL